METGSSRDQMVLATMYTVRLRANIRKEEPLERNSATGMHISVGQSLEKLKAYYFDILYMHWWVKKPTLVSYKLSA